MKAFNNAGLQSSVADIHPHHVLVETVVVLHVWHKAMYNLQSKGLVAAFIFKRVEWLAVVVQRDDAVCGADINIPGMSMLNDVLDKFLDT